MNLDNLSEDKPEPGKIYALTGGHDTPTIENGNTWAESEVKKDKIQRIKIERRQNEEKKRIKKKK